MLDSVLNASIPMIFLIAFGYFISLAKVIDSAVYPQLIQLVMQIFFPCTILYNLTFQQLQAQDFIVIFSELAGSVVLAPFIFVFTLFYRDRAKKFAEIFSSTNISNLLLSGIEITSGFYDYDETVKYAYIESFGECVLQIPISIMIYELQSQTEGNFKAIIKKVALNTIRSPMVITIIVSVVLNIIRTFSVGEIQLPLYLSQILQQFSEMISSVGIICVGMFIHELEVNKDKFKQNGWLVLSKFCLQGILKSFIFPLVVLFCMKLTTINTEGVKINVSLSACHSGVMTFAEASQYNVEQLVAGTMVAAGLLWTIVFTIAFDYLVESMW